MTAETGWTSRRTLWLLAAVMLLSGASALTYEILWQRQMFLIFGASAPATTAILTAIFLGIAVGSRLAPWLMRVIRQPVLLYAMIEAVMGGWGFLVPSVLRLSDSLYVSSTHALGENHLLLYLLRFLLAVIPLLPATLAMGASIPVMVRCVSRPGRSAVAWAYGINTLGAVAGCLLTGLVWLRILGLDHTRLAAVGLNTAAVIILLIVYRLEKTSSASDRVASTVPPIHPAGARAWSIMYFLAGFVTLGLEVLWLRFLGIVTSNSTATFTLTLTVYLLGMSIGSLFLYPLLRRKLSPQLVFTLSNGATALAALMTLGTVYAAAGINHEYIRTPATAGTLTLADIYWTEARITFQLMFIPTLFMGLTYPAICECFSGEPDQRSHWISTTYFWGTLGSVFGILLVGTGFVPWIDLHGTFALLICILTALCFCSFRVSGAATAAADAASPRSGTRNLPVGVFCGVLVIWSGLVAHDPQPVLRNTLAQKTGRGWLEVDVLPPHRVQSRLIRVKAGPSATVMIKQELDQDIELVYVDDQLVASTNLEAKVDSLMLAHLPLLLHPKPTSGLTVGFGTGGTSQSMMTHGIKASCVEIEPEVISSYHLIRKDDVDVTADPDFSLILNDARDHLHAGRESYDVIVTDVTNLQYKQNGSLYTVEYFELMREKLNTGGIACAWIPMAAIDSSELQILMHSFQVVFPHATLWFMNHTHTNFGILVGTPDELSIDYRRLEAGFGNPEIADDLRSIGISEPLQLIHSLHLDERGYRQFCHGAAVHTDNMPILEFSSPLSFYRYDETFYQNLGASLQLRPGDCRGYVANRPADLDAEFARHERASRCFCEVLLRFYQFQIQVSRKDSRKAIEALNEAIELAREGMDAWPEDSVRERFYIQFFESATKWVQQNAGR